MVLILDHCLNHENSNGVPESLEIKRKPFEMEAKPLNDVYNFSSGSSHFESVLQVFNEFRVRRLFTDVILAVQGCEFHCHRAILSANSSYFLAMFCNDHKESREKKVEIKDIQPDGMEVFLQYVYTSHARITTKNVRFVFETANLFQNATLRDACAKFLEEQLDPCNCLGFQRFADAHSLKQLASRFRTFALANFPDVVQHEEFLELHKDEVEEYFASDELSTGREEMVFEAVMRWVYHDVEYRKPMLKDLLQHVRLPLLHPNYFVQTVEGDKLIQNAPECYQLLHEARRYHVLGNEMMSPRTRPRRSTGFSEVIVVVGGCERMGGFNLPYTECYDPVTGEWTSLSKHPEYTKSEYAVCALRNDIIVSGGRINSSFVWMYNSQLNVWIRVASLNKGRWRHKMTVLLGKVYVVGGFDGQCYLNNVEVYDSFSNRWTEVAPMKEAVSSPAVTSCAGKLFVIGGESDENNCSNKVQCYNSETDSWELKAFVPFSKANISAVSLNQLIYVCGGLTNSIYCYDPPQDHWIHVGHTFSRRESCGISVCNGKIYILGGWGENGEASNGVVCFDPASGIITLTEALPRPMSYHGCVTIHRFREKQYKP
ncbi:hypothetical protein DNTS_035414 [Danionella cerebrum]|uniref:BTB domain-containing protein n=1 Tax=Danionella cerebrum TaxID=2873325 RepID=A0A553NWB9_9TELE|nr:hypothetical protein DNTS_035414 [Danionella translucida]